MAAVEKLVVDGKVAVIYSPYFGSGWSTWSNHDDGDGALLFDKDLAQAIVLGDEAAKREVADRKFPNVYKGSGFKDLTVEWLPIGTRFRVDEYDGSESIVTLEDLWYVA